MKVYRSKVEAKRIRNTTRVRQKLFLKGKSDRLYLKFNRGNRTLTGMVLDREGKVLVYGDDRTIRSENVKMNRSERAYLLGKKVGQESVGLGAVGFVLDRKWYRYHGVVRNFTEGFRVYCKV